ncbi:hypothetical protein EU546_00720 [Candidatus Thorarchaeota archaeon]|nr:MAG: hypothetical protein EU546_00720 [Candidatus Thorarchaeota archaeon]
MSEPNHLTLPYCPYCRTYKGVGTCRSTRCPGSSRRNLLALKQRTDEKSRSETTCMICGHETAIECDVCYGAYCQEHALGHNEQTLESKDQRVGTCAMCGRVVCENCWILNSMGRIICLRHLGED